MPVIEGDPGAARDRLAAAGVTVTGGNTDHERWRAEHGGATAVAYDDKVVVQGSDPARLTTLLQDGGGRGHVYFDGASRGNPGPAAVGWAIVTSDGVVAEGSERIDDTTNNKAEYAALVRAVEAARDYGLAELDLRGDSQLVVKQVRGEWQVNEPTLREKRVRARELLEGFDRWSLEHVPREINERADELANEAFDDG
ncbi:ribonuclease HI [Halorarum halobium]|uniref:ribonuclease HI n=1 Tax=Halorarum halobium TaxID=3075121 RepID=UPI0028A5F86D|nr:ribonuclease HI [Halobaculum sp. XH14]